MRHSDRQTVLAAGVHDGKQFVSTFPSHGLLSRTLTDALTCTGERLGPVQQPHRRRRASDGHKPQTAMPREAITALQGAGDIFCLVTGALRAPLIFLATSGITTGQTGNVGPSPSRGSPCTCAANRPVPVFRFAPPEEGWPVCE